MRQAQREMTNYERRKINHRAWYSLDAYSWMENYALEHARSPEDILMEQEDRAAYLQLLAALPKALYRATPTQARRVYAPASHRPRSPAGRAYTAARSRLPSIGA